jgi:iron complex outermembrane recepter protein
MIMMRKYKLLALAVAAALEAVGAAPAFAAADQTSVPQLAEIVVTATKRPTTLQTTPASISAITGSEIASRGLVDFNSLAASVPGISMRTSGPGETEFEMRGLNSSGGDASMVGFYLGDVPLSAPFYDQIGKVVVDPSLYDLGRVEVLRGPQGTLYGASSMGGTVRLVPNAPELNTFDASGEEVVGDTTDGGSINHRENGMVNLPIGGTLALRIVGSFESDSGWIERRVIADGAVPVDSGVFPDDSRPANFYTAPLQAQVNGANTTQVESVRMSLLWKPTDNLSVTPMVMYQLTQQKAPNAVDVNGTPTDPTVPDVNAHWEIYDTPEPQRDRFDLSSVTVSYQLPTFTLTSATGYWNRGSLISQDATEENAAAIGIPVYDGGIGPTGPAPNGPGATEADSTHQTSEELRLTSTAPGSLQWIAGWFYQDLYSDTNLQSILSVATPILGGPVFAVIDMPQTLIQNAEFGELSYRLSRHWKVAASVRHYHYSLSETQDEWGVITPNSYLGNDVPFNSAASNGANGSVPKVDLQYAINGRDMVYATVSKGFRLGGVNVAFPVASPAASTNTVLIGDECGLQAKLLNNTACSYPGLLQAPTTFSNDRVWSYEIGEKSSFLDNRMQLDVSGYYENWSNPQVATDIGGVGLTANGGDAHIKGAEAELRALLSEDWDIVLNYGYTDARFVQSSVVTGFPSGVAIPDTPKSTASAILRYEHEMNDGLSVFGSLEWDYVGSRLNAPYGETVTLWNYNSLLVHLPAYNLANLRLGLNGERWTATLFVDNLTDKEVLLDPQPQIDLQMAAVTRYTVNRPRTVGLDISYRFH